MNPDLYSRILDLAIAIQQIPAPTFAEAQRARFMADRFRAEGLQDVGQDEVGNVYACLPGSGQALPLVISAHLDTVFPEGTDLSIRRDDARIHAPAIGDNSLGLAGLLGLLWALRQKWYGDVSIYPSSSPLPGDIWLVANVGEEGLGDLRGMRGVVQRFDQQVTAYLVLEGLALGLVYHRGLGVKRYRITIRTEGGHSWVDFGRPSAIHELAALINCITALPLPEQPRTTLNVGVIAGGTTVNTIAAQAHLELDLRSESSAMLENLSGQVESLVRQANRPAVLALFEVIGHRQAGEISAQHPLVQLAQECLVLQGIQANLAIGSTDANVPLSRGLPAICLGLAQGGGAHTVGEYIQISTLVQGLGHIVEFVERVFQKRKAFNSTKSAS